MAFTRQLGRSALLRLTLATVGLGLSTGAAVTPAPATAEQRAAQEVVFSLRWQGKPAGTHTTTVRHYAPKTAGGDETRIIESYEDIRGADVPEALWRRTRATARAKGTTLSFTAVTETGPEGSGRVTEVNGRRGADGAWTVHITRGPATETLELRRSQADLCTLDLLDPLLHTRMVDRGVVRLLDVTTGTVLDGTAQDMGELSVEIQGQPAAARRYALEASGQTWQWDWNLEGLLIRYDTRLGDGPLTAQPESMPALRSWGSVDTPTRFDNGVPVMQDEL